MSDPLERFIKILPKDFTSVAKQYQEENAARSLGSMKVNPADELIRSRFLERGGSLLLVGPTGIGKSSLTMQIMLSWCLGKDCFGMTPVRPLRCLLIQAENNDGDLAEQRDGVLSGANLTPEERAQAFNKILVCCESSKTGDNFIARLHTLLDRHRPDVVFVDPAFSYVGGNVSKQEVITPFLRNKINPLVQKYHVGIVIIHHTNKPIREKDRSAYMAGDYAYLGAGSAEWANWSRAVMALQSTREHGKFLFLAGKRGSRLNWKGSAGEDVYEKGLAHGEKGTICWHEIPVEELSTGDDKEEHVSVEQKIADLWFSKKEILSSHDFKVRAAKTKVTKQTFCRWLREGETRGVFTGLDKDQLRLTGKFTPRFDVSTNDSEQIDSADSDEN